MARTPTCSAAATARFAGKVPARQAGYFVQFAAFFDRGSSNAARRTFSRPFIGLHTGRAQLGPLVRDGDVMHASSDDGRCAVLPGVATRKMHSTRRDAFRALNAAPIAHVEVGHDGCRRLLGDTYAKEASKATPREAITSPAAYRTT